MNPEIREFNHVSDGFDILKNDLLCHPLEASRKAIGSLPSTGRKDPQETLMEQRDFMVLRDESRGEGDDGFPP